MNISCKISSSDFSVPLGLEIWINDLLIFNIDHVKEIIDVDHEISDDEAEHELRFILKNKISAHTQIDENGNITKDAVITVSDLKFEDIELGQLFYDLTVYEHDFNGNGATIQDKFHGSLGCNGTVTLKFNTPIYLWLLENM